MFPTGPKTFPDFRAGFIHQIIDNSSRLLREIIVQVLTLRYQIAGNRLTGPQRLDYLSS